MFEWIRRWWRNKKLAATFAARLTWMDQVMREVDCIAQSPEVKASLPELAERFAYLCERMVVVVPQIDCDGALSLVHLTDPKNEKLPALMVFPLLASDASISHVAADFCKHAKPASYAAASHLIIIGMGESGTFRDMAATLFHEAGHAIAADQEKRILDRSFKRDERARLEEELQMWHFDCRLAGFLGGESLRQQIDQTAKDIISGWMSGTPFRLKVKSSTPLDLCYGATDDERSFGRRTILYMQYCELVALHMFFGPAYAHSRQLEVIAKIRDGSYLEKSTIG